jgi:molybdate transport system ATP-binding protein
MPERTAEPFLKALLHSRLGNFSLKAEFSLSARWTVLFGPSGVGKTSVMRMLAGLIRPEDGYIVLNGRVLLDTANGVSIPPGLRGVGFATQRPALFQHMTVAENVAFGLHSIASDVRIERVQAMLELMEVAPLASRKPADLSGGEQQRVSLARTLAPEPRLVLLDEPFSALDASLKERILAKLEEWLGLRGIPAFYVSHDLAEAYQTDADVIVMQEGSVVAHGTARDVLAEERDRLLRRLADPD